MIDPKLLDADPRLSRLHGLLQHAQARLRMQEAASLAPWAAGLGLAAGALLAGIDRFAHLMPLDVLLATGAGLVLAALLTALLYALLRSRDLMLTARQADHLLSMDERLSTALEDASSPPTNPTPEQTDLREAQLDDALSAASGLSVKSLRVTLPGRRLLPVALMLALFMAVIFVPFPANSNQATQAQVTAERKNIEILKQAVQSQPHAADDPTLKSLLQELAQLSKDLDRGNLSREEAIARLSETQSKLEKALDPQASAQKQALDELAKQLAASGMSEAGEAAKDAGEALKSGDPQKAADTLKKASEQAATMSPQQRKELAQTLKQAQGNVAALDPQLAQSLNDAANALESNDPKAAEQAMKNLGQRVEDNSQNVATQQQVQQALAQIQQSKANIAQAGQPTAVAASAQGSTPVAQGTGTANGTPASQGTGVANGTSAAQGTGVANGTPLSGTPIASLGSPVSGTPVASLGSPIAGTPVALGSPVQGTLVASQGQGQGSGSGAQQAQAAGQGQGQNQGSGSQNSQSGGQGGGQGGSSWGKGHEEPVYAPPSNVSTSLTPVSVQGQNNPNGEQSSMTTNTNVNNAGPALVPYEQVYGQYQQQAGNALKSDYIPQGYKDLVRDYFSNIEPGK